MGRAVNLGGSRVPACAGGALDHRHGVACLPVLVALLPLAPVGWRWQYGRNGGGWACWIERVGGAPARWAVTGLPHADTAGHLAVILDGYLAGHQGHGFPV